MAIRSIRENVDTSLLRAVDAYLHQPATTGGLLCRFSLAPNPVQSDAVLTATASIISHYSGELYFLKNNDVLVVWQGPLAQIEANLKNLIRGHFRGIVTKIGETNFFQFFDVREQAAAVRALLSNQMPMATDSAVILPPAQLEFTEDQLVDLRQGIRDRNSKRGFESMGLNIMVIEDQEFSLKLMKSLLSREHHCVTSQTAAEAITLYASQPPDILFLDVELPDANGHDFASFIKRHDPESYIVMVTANTETRDVKAAQKNSVQGYITKPFRQQKIRASVDAYIQRHSI